MARCGCEFDSLCSMFPKMPKEDIIAVWNYQKMQKKYAEQIFYKAVKMF